MSTLFVGLGQTTGVIPYVALVPIGIFTVTANLPAFIMTKQWQETTADAAPWHIIKAVGQSLPGSRC